MCDGWDGIQVCWSFSFSVAGVAEWISVEVFCLLVSLVLSGYLFSVCGFSVSVVRVGRAAVAAGAKGRLREL